MRFSVAAVLGLATSALAQYDPTPGFNPLTKPVSNEVIPAGTTFTIEWTPAGQTGPVSLVLYGGDSASTLQSISTIGSNIDATLKAYDWAVDPSLGSAKAYGIRIVLDSNTTIFQWSNPFTISGSSTGSSSSSGSTASTTASPSSTLTTVTTGTQSTSSKFSAAVTPSGNLSTSATASRTTATSTVVQSGSGASTTSGTTIPTGGAVAVSVGSFALFGGVAMAILGM